MVFVPHSLDRPSILAVKHTFSFHHVFFEVPLEHFSIRKLQPAMSFLQVFIELTYITPLLPS